MGRRPGSKNKPKEAPQAVSGQPDKVSPIEKPKRSPGAKKAAKNGTVAAPSTASAATQESSTQHRNLVIMDASTGEIQGEAPDFRAIPDTMYSHSFVKDIHACTAKAYFRKTHAPARKVFALERGTVAHTLIEGWEKEGEDPVAGLPDAWKHYILDCKDQFSPEDQEKIEKGFTDTQRMLAEFVFENADVRHRIRPEDVEVPFKILVTINTSVGPIRRWLVGKIDLVLWNEDRTSFNIIDWKTSAKAPHASELEIGVQFATYQIACKELYGQEPRTMTYYLLAGEHICRDSKGASIRFSSNAHPRELGKRVPGCEVNYAIRVSRKSPEQLQALLDDYYSAAIYKWELGIVGKDGKHDPRSLCSMCQYKDFCDSFSVKNLPAPVFVK